MSAKKTFKCRFNLGPIFKHEFEIKKLGHHHISSYLFIYQVTSYHKKKLQLPLGISPKHRNKQFL